MTTDYKNKYEYKTEEVSYSELARRVGDCVLNINIRNSDEFSDWEVFNGETDYCYTHETKEECKADEYTNCNHEYHDIYQDYIITESGAEYLERNTNEIVFYNSKLDMYVWGITHYGTSWDGVFTSVKL